MSINVIFRCFHTAHVSALIIAYKSFVRPILEYCSTVWNPYIPNRHYLGLTDQIETVQRYFTRRVYYRCKLDCSHDYLQRLKYLNLEQSRATSGPRRRSVRPATLLGNNIAIRPAKPQLNKSRFHERNYVA